MWNFVAVIITISFGYCSSLGAVDTRWMKNTLQAHFSQTRHHVTGETYKNDAKQFIVQEFTSYGLSIEQHEFSTSLPAVNGTNIIGVLKGKRFGQETDILSGIGAHYDTMRTTPGVDDNGAGVVAMLQAAKRLSTGSRQNTVLFIAFDFEEWESGVPDIACSAMSCGSDALLGEWFQSFLLKSYGQATLDKSLPTFEGIYILDTVMNFDEQNNTQDLPFGFDQVFPNVDNSIKSDQEQGDFIALISRNSDRSLSEKFSGSWESAGSPEYELEAVKLPIDGIPTATDKAMYGDFFRSDHAVFWERGYKSIFLTDTANFRGTMRTCYHAACDDFSKVTDKKMAFLGKLATALISSIDKTSPYISDAASYRMNPLVVSLLAAVMFMLSMG